jgi:hypothetical protein
MAQVSPRVTAVAECNGSETPPSLSNFFADCQQKYGETGENAIQHFHPIDFGMCCFEHHSSF